MNSIVILIHHQLQMDSGLNIYKYDLNEYLYYNVYYHFTELKLWVFFGVLILLHNFIKFKKQITKYFLIHFIFNMYVSINTVYDTITIFNQPYNIQSVSNYISFLVVLFHIYHVIFYHDKIQIDELIHHIWIVFILMPITWLYYCNLANSSLFFMTGFPGGLVYLLLVLKDMDVINSLTEKRISKYLHMWIRIPGAVIVGYIIYANAVKSESYISYFSLLFCTMGSIWNGIYFGSTIIGSHAVLKHVIGSKLNID